MKIIDIGKNAETYRIYIEFDDNGQSRKLELSMFETTQLMSQLRLVQSEIQALREQDDAFRKAGRKNT